MGTADVIKEVVFHHLPSPARLIATSAPVSEPPEGAPLRNMPAAPEIPAIGWTYPAMGAVMVAVGSVTVKEDVSVFEVWPSGFVTVIEWKPVGASVVTMMLARSVLVFV